MSARRGKCCWLNEMSLLPSLLCYVHGEEEEQKQSYHQSLFGVLTLHNVSSLTLACLTPMVDKLLGLLPQRGL